MTTTDDRPTADEYANRDVIAEAWPCPPWCTREKDSDHLEFESWDSDTGAQTRPHRAWITVDEDAPLVVSIFAYKHLLPGRHWVETPTVDVLAGRGDVESAEQARALAADLLRAAEMLDGLVAS